MLTPKELTELEEKRDLLEAEVETYKEKKQALYDANKEKVDARSKHASARSFRTTIAIIALIVGVGAFLFVKGMAGIAVLAVGCLIFVMFLILRAKSAKEVKNLSSGLSEYDKNYSSILESIQKLNVSIADIDNKINQDRLEKQRAEEKQNLERKYAACSQNHICVYVGTSTSKGLVNGKPQETASYYSEVPHVTVYIDGVEYGGTEKPFGAFAVTPGYHVVKMEAYYKFGSVDQYIESKAQQVNVTEKSAFMFYHWNFYSDDKGVHKALFLNVFDNVYDFLKHTHQS